MWGISLGGQYASLAGALYPDLFDAVVISAAATDYERSYIGAFDASLDAARPLGANTQVALSAKFARWDVVAAIAPRPLVFEIALGDLSEGTIAFVERAEEIAIETRSPRPRVILFEGEHETNPEVTAPVIADILLRPGRPPKR